MRNRSLLGRALWIVQREMLARVAVLRTGGRRLRMHHRVHAYRTDFVRYSMRGLVFEPYALRKLQHCVPGGSKRPGQVYAECM